MVNSGRLVRGLEVASHIAVATAAVVLIGVVLTGRFSVGRADARSAKSAAVQDIDHEHLVVAVQLRTEGGRVGQPIIVEASDFSCPFCKRYATEVFPSLKRELLDTKRVGYAFLQYPLEAIHQDALGAAEQSECAAEQHKFWEAHDVLFGEQKDQATRTNDHFVETLSLNSADFDRCMKTAEGRVRVQIAEGKRLKVSGTPTVFIGTLEASGNRVRLQKRINGFIAYDALKAAIQSIMQASS